MTTMKLMIGVLYHLTTSVTVEIIITRLTIMHLEEMMLHFSVP